MNKALPAEKITDQTKATQAIRDFLGNQDCSDGDGSTIIPLLMISRCEPIIIYDY